MTFLPQFDNPQVPLIVGAFEVIGTGDSAAPRVVNQWRKIDVI